MAARKKAAKKPKRKNPVAKHAARFQRAAKHKDRKKAVKRGETRHVHRLMDES